MNKIKMLRKLQEEKGLPEMVMMKLTSDYKPEKPWTAAMDNEAVRRLLMWDIIITPSVWKKFRQEMGAEYDDGGIWLRCRKSTKNTTYYGERGELRFGTRGRENTVPYPPDETTDERALSQMPDGGYFICPHCHTVYSMTRIEPGTAIVRMPEDDKYKPEDIRDAADSLAQTAAQALLGLNEERA